MDGTRNAFVTTYDRYLLSRFLYIFAVFFVAAIGLFTVVDGFTNLDDFQVRTDGFGELFLRMTQYYGYQSLLIVDLAGPTLCVISIMCVLAIFLKNGEVHPVLAAGVPTYRLTLPLVIGVLLVNAMLIANQELVLPRIAPHLQGHHGDTAASEQKVREQYDPKWWIFVTGKSAIPAEKRIHHPKFQLPAQTLAQDFVWIEAEDAIYKPPVNGVGGWHLINLKTDISDLGLTSSGEEIVIPQPDGSLFIASTLTFDQVSRQTSNYRLVSTWSLIQRLQLPAGSLISRRALLTHLHSRLTRPILILIGAFIVVPLIVRRDKMGPMAQVTNIATCMLTLGVVFGISMGTQFLGQSGLLRPDQAVWGPLVLSGSFAGWLSGIVRT